MFAPYANKGADTRPVLLKYPFHSEVLDQSLVPCFVW